MIGGDTWYALTGIARIDDNTTRLTLTGIGVSAPEFVEITGVGGTTLFEDLKFTATVVDADNIDIDWLAHGYTAPPDTWTIGGMVREYQAITSWPGGIRISFNPHTITGITTTGNTGEFGVDNVSNSNRGSTHTLNGGSDHALVATVETGSLINSVALLDLAIDLNAQIRIRGNAAIGAVDVVYPAISARYSLAGRPAIGYPGVQADGHNLNDPIAHFMRYVPPMVTGSVTVDILGAANNIAFSELLLTSYWKPSAQLKNYNFGASLVGGIVSTDIRRGKTIHRKRDGLDLSRTVTFTMAGEVDSIYLDLLLKSGRTIIFDSYPLAEPEKRWRNMVVGYISGRPSFTEQRKGTTVELNAINSKLLEDITEQ